jgi:hypothetical protein
MVCYDDGLTIRPEICVNRPCNETCTDKICEQCWNCLNRNERYERHVAYREAKNRGAFRRTFPPSMVT